MLTLSGCPSDRSSCRRETIRTPPSREAEQRSGAALVSCTRTSRVRPLGQLGHALAYKQDDVLVRCGKVAGYDDGAGGQGPVSAGRKPVDKVVEVVLSV